VGGIFFGLPMCLHQVPKVFPTTFENVPQVHNVFPIAFFILYVMAKVELSCI
jgi:hypothetical protein